MERKYLIAGTVVVILVAVGGVALAMNRANQPTSFDATAKEDIAVQLSLKFSDLQANYPANPDACLATKDEPSLKLDEAAETDIENAVISAIIDIPAGTNVDVYFKTYEKDTATGTSIYESTYGSYNFTAKKILTANSDKGTWVVSKFVACKR